MTQDENDRIIDEINKSQFANKINYNVDSSLFSVTNSTNTDIFAIIKFIKEKLNIDYNIEIKDDIIFVGEDIYTFDFSNCIFQGMFIFRRCRFIGPITISYSEFHKTTVFIDSYFKHNVRFHETDFRVSVDFENTTFNELADFYCAQFFKTQRFHRTDFLGKAIFSNVVFHEQVQFKYNKVKTDTIISFENAEFKQFMDISRSNFWCQLQFWGIKLNETVPTNLWLYENDEIFEESINKIKFAYPRIRESYRIIKQSFRKEGNNIEALKFHQKELFVFKAEKGLYKNSAINLKSRWHIVISKFRKHLQCIEEYITIWFNYFSNNFGQSWTRGLVFTLIVTIIFFSIFLIFSDKSLEFDFKSKSIVMTLKYYIQFLNLTNWDYSPFGINIQKDYPLGYIILFIGRIFIGYGYYQIIQAFRKFGKN